MLKDEVELSFRVVIIGINLYHLFMWERSQTFNKEEENGKTGIEFRRA